MAVNCGWPAIVVTAGTEFQCTSIQIKRTMSLLTRFHMPYPYWNIDRKGKTDFTKYYGHQGIYSISKMPLVIDSLNNSIICYLAGISD